jgi:microsomal dipeptidase-like Zn-dependent dipeptidase
MWFAISCTPHGLSFEVNRVTSQLPPIFQPPTLCEITEVLAAVGHLCCNLGHDTVCFGSQFTGISEEHLLKMYTPCSSKTLVIPCQNTQLHTPVGYSYGTASMLRVT